MIEERRVLYTVVSLFRLLGRSTLITHPARWTYVAPPCRSIFSLLRMIAHESKFISIRPSWLARPVTEIADTGILYLFPLLLPMTHGPSRLKRCQELATCIHPFTIQPTCRSRSRSEPVTDLQSCVKLIATKSSLYLYSHSPIQHGGSQVMVSSVTAR